MFIARVGMRVDGISTRLMSDTVVQRGTHVGCRLRTIQLVLYIKSLAHNKYVELWLS